MPSFPLHGAQKTENAGAVTSTSRGTAVTASGSANTKGSYAELIAATAFISSWIWVMIDDVAAGVDYLIDIAIGGAGSEVVICSNLYAGAGTGSINYGWYLFPIQVPAGVRLSARCQASTASSVARVSAMLFAGEFDTGSMLQKLNTMGDATADSGGTSIDPGGTVNTKGSYTQIVSSTPRPIKSLVIAFGNQANNVRSSQSWLVDIAIGGSGSEKVILPNIAINASTSPDIVTPQVTPPLPVNIPAGTRIAARAQSDGNDATDRLFDVILYGA